MKIEVDTRQSDRTLQNVLRGLKDATELHSLIGEEYTLGVDDRFKFEIDPDGSPWAANSPAWSAYKRRKGFIDKSNQMRGTTRATISYQAYSDRVEIGAYTPYSVYMQAARPFLHGKDEKLGRKDEEAIERVTNEYLQDLVAKGER